MRSRVQIFRLPVLAMVSVLAASLAGCGGEFKVPTGYVFQCSSDADCPIDGSCREGACVIEGQAICGNGFIETDEVCDDGNLADGDYCSADCQSVIGSCGDGTLQVDLETCDDGNTADGDYCAADCQSVIGSCGDGTLQVDLETCDDGNTADGDYCASDCQSVTGSCGDGVLQAGLEVCDQGEANSNLWSPAQTCRADCQGYASYCGDGMPAEEELCDQGDVNVSGYAGTNAEACSTQCQPASHCGDGIWDIEFEVCDDGELASDAYLASTPQSAACNSTCTGVQPFCGDAVIQAGEECDDGNNVVEDCPYTFTTCAPVCGATCRWVQANPNHCGDGDLGEEGSDEALSELCDDGDAFSTIGTCSGSCSEDTLCADGRSHLGICAPADKPRVWQSRFLANGWYRADYVEHRLRCAISNRGILRCDDTSDETVVPEDLGPVTDVSIVGGQICAVRVDGTVRCWGQVSWPPHADCEETSTILDPPDLANVARVMVSRFSACAILEDGTLECWGGDRDPETGDIGCLRPIVIPEEINKVVDAQVGYDGGCVVDLDGNPVCWTYDRGVIDISNDSGTGFAMVGNSIYGRRCGLRSNGEGIECWSDIDGLVSDAATLPANVDEFGIVDGGLCAVTSQGRVECIGSKKFVDFVPSAADLGFVEGLALNAYDEACVLNQRGEVHCWYVDTQLAYSDPNPSEKEELTRPGGATLKLQSGEKFFCMLSDEGQPLCFGDNYYDQLNFPGDIVAQNMSVSSNGVCFQSLTGDWNCYGRDSFQNDAPNDLSQFEYITFGDFHSCGLKSDKTLDCWGLIEGIDLGDFAENVRNVTSDWFSTCVTRTDGVVQCFKVDLSTWSMSVDAEMPADLRDARAFAMGERHTCVLLADDEIQCWGSEADEAALTVPTGLENVVAISASRYYTCAVLATGQLECWGTWIPIIPDDLAPVSDLVTGENFACSLLGNGNVRCWGYHQYSAEYGYKERYGFKEAPFGYTRSETNDYQFEAICPEGQTYAGRLDPLGDETSPLIFGCE